MWLLLQGRELITGKPGDEKEYFRLHINQYNTIETITCLSKKVIDLLNTMYFSSDTAYAGVMLLNKGANLYNGIYDIWLFFFAAFLQQQPDLFVRPTREIPQQLGITIRGEAHQQLLLVSFTQLPSFLVS